MNLTNLFEGAVDELEKRRIEDLEAKMDDLHARARKALDDGNSKAFDAYRQEFMKAKAERDSYHYVNEAPGAETLSHNQSTVADNENALDLEEVRADRTGSWVVYNGSKIAKFKTHNGAVAYAEKNGGKVASSEFYADKIQNKVEEHGGGGGGPAQWHAYVKAHRADEEYTPITKPVPQPRKLNPGWALDPTTKAELKRRKDVRNRKGVDEDSQRSIGKAFIDLGKQVADRIHDDPDDDGNSFWFSNTKSKHVPVLLQSIGRNILYNGIDAGMEEFNNTVTDLDLKDWIKDNLEAPLPVDEGWSDKVNPTPYGVYINGKQWKEFPTDDHARAVANKLEAKLKAEGRTDKVTFAPSEKYMASLGKNVDEETMDQAAHNPSGAKFGGYYKGTQVGAPKPGQSFGAESIENEGAKVDRMVKHIAKSERDTGKSANDAESIAWATANKRGMLDNANKKDESVDNSHATNFLSWVLNQGSRFRGFTDNPETYAKAKEAYKREHGAEPVFNEGMSNALSNITRRIAQPVSANTIIKNREQKKDSIKRQHFAEDDITEIFGPEWQAVGGALNFAKEHGIPMMAFAAVAAAYGISKAAKELEQGEGRFKKIAAKAIKAVDKNVIHKMANKLQDISARAMAEEQTSINEIKKGQKDSNGNTGCWDGYHAAGTKKGKNGGQVRNCVPNESIEEDWQKANKKDKTDGMSQKAVNAYKRENPGSKLKTAVTTKPSKLKKGSKDSKRRSSYCARSKGQKDMHNIDCTKTPDKAICKARKRWNCESQEQFDAMLREAVEKGTLQPGQYYVWTVHFDDGTNKRVKVTKDTFDPKAYYAKQNKIVVNVDYDWVAHNG